MEISGVRWTFFSEEKPGTSKSQLLQYAYNLVPRSQYTSGKGSSAVGLIAYFTKVSLVLHMPSIQILFSDTFRGGLPTLTTKLWYFGVFPKDLEAFLDGFLKLPAFTNKSWKKAFLNTILESSYPYFILNASLTNYKLSRIPRHANWSCRLVPLCWRTTACAASTSSTRWATPPTRWWISRLSPSPRRESGIAVKSEEDDHGEHQAASYSHVKVSVDTLNSCSFLHSYIV